MDRERVRSSVERKSTVSFARSGGPGGQNVNKVNTKVLVSIRSKDIEGLDMAEAARLVHRYAGNNGISKEASGEENGSGENAEAAEQYQGAVITVTVQDERSQAVNRAIAVERLTDKICNACRIPKKRRPTKPTRASKERRLKLKAIRAEVKRRRRHPSCGD